MYVTSVDHVREYSLKRKGKALVKGGSRQIVVTSGNVLFIPSQEEHQFKNIGDEPVEFLCTKEVSV
jgi:mannose-6-phosphate isomerase-like protein (cupin superfamily)